MKPKENSRDPFLLTWKGLGLLLAIIFLVWIGYAYLITKLVPDFDDRGISGDMFGGITALFSGLAFAGLIFTLFVQKKELEYQREELSRLVNETADTKTHLEAQATHLKSQSDFVGKQTFENTFFQLLASFNANLRSIEVTAAPHLPDKRGADALEVIYRKVYQALKPTDTGFHNNYSEVYKKHKNDLGPYFRQMYNILKFVKKSEVRDKEFYSNILRAQLSSPELSLLAVNCCSALGRSKMAPLVKEYNFLKHFDDVDLIDLDEELSNFYRDWGLNILPRSWT